MKISNPESHTASRGAGGCHSGLFGRTTIHMSPEGDGTGGGGASSAAPVVAASGTVTPATQPAAANGEKLFTQAEVNAITGERLARDRQERAAAQPAPRAATTQEAAKPLSMEQQFADLQRRAEFNDHVADYSIPRDRRSDLFDLYKAQSPADPVAWFASKAPIFGATAASAPTTNPSTSNNTSGAGTGAQVETKPPPAASTTAPARVDIPTNGGLVDVLALSPQQIDQLGPVGLREIHERNITAGRQQHGAPSLPRAVLAQKR